MRDFVSEFKRKVKRIDKPAEVTEDPVVVPTGTFSVVRRTLPATKDVPLFFNLSEHEAKNLVFRVLKARVHRFAEYSRAIYYDWIKEAV